MTASQSPRQYARLEREWLRIFVDEVGAGPADADLTNWKGRARPA